MGDFVKVVVFAAAAIAASIATAAQAADTHTTLEVGYTRSDFSNTSPNFGLNTVDVRGGYQMTKHWGAEMEGAFGVGSTDVSVGGVNVSVKQDWEVGLYGVGYLPLPHNFDLIGRVGYSRTQITASAGGFSDKGQDNGAAAGVGLRQFPGGGANGWRVDYTHHFYGSDNLDTFSVGYVRRF